MLVTGQRKGEIMGLHAPEIDYDKGLWVLPASRAKNGREHLIPLSEAARWVGLKAKFATGLRPATYRTSASA